MFLKFHMFALIQLLGVIFLVILSGSLTRSRLTRSHVLLELVPRSVLTTIVAGKKLKLPISISYVNQ